MPGKREKKRSLITFVGRTKSYIFSPYLDRVAACREAFGGMLAHTCVEMNEDISTHSSRTLFTLKYNDIIFNTISMVTQWYSAQIQFSGWAFVDAFADCFLLS
jgi:hypothetical protein